MPCDTRGRVFKVHVAWSLLLLFSLVSLSLVHHHLATWTLTTTATTTVQELQTAAAVYTDPPPVWMQDIPTYGVARRGAGSYRNTTVRCTRPLVLGLPNLSANPDDRESTSTLEEPRKLIQNATEQSWERCHFQWLSFSRGVFTIHGEETRGSQQVRARGIILSREDRTAAPFFVRFPVERRTYSFNERECTRILRGKLYLIHRWHTKNFCHTHESLFLLWRAMRAEGDLGKEHPTLGKPMVVALDGEDSLSFSGYWAYLAQTTFRLMDLHPPVAYSRVCFEHAIVVGYDVVPSLHRASSNMLDAYRKFWFHFADNVAYTPVKASKPPFRNVRLQRWNDTTEPRIVLVKRESSRVLLNEKELIDALRSRTGVNDVRVVDFATLSLQDQIKLLQKTTILLAAHSGALAQILWMQPGSTVVQFLPHGISFGTDYYESLGLGYPPYILNVEELSRKLGLFFVNIMGEEETSRTLHCKTAASLYNNEKKSGGIEYQCYFYANFTINVDKVVDAVETHLRTGIHLGLIHWTPESVARVRRIIIPRTTSDSESVAFLVDRINAQKRLGIVSAHAATIKSSDRSGLFLPDFKADMFTAGNEHPQYARAFTLPSPFFPHNLRSRDVFLMTDALPPLMQYYVREATEKGANVWFLAVGRFSSCGPYRCKRKDSAQSILEETVQHLHPSRIVATTHWLCALHHCQRPILRLPLSPEVFKYVSKHPAKEDLVVIDRDNYVAIEKLRPHVPQGMELVRLDKHTNEETIRLLQRAKVVVDLWVGGMERIILSGALLDCCVLMGDKWNGEDAIDYPVDPSLKFPVHHRNYAPFEWPEIPYASLGASIQDMVRRYDELLPEFHQLKELVQMTREDYKSVLVDLVDEMIIND